MSIPRRNFLGSLAALAVLPFSFFPKKEIEWHQYSPSALTEFDYEWYFDSIGTVKRVECVNHVETVLYPPEIQVFEHAQISFYEKMFEREKKKAKHIMFPIESILTFYGETGELAYNAFNIMRKDIEGKGLHELKFIHCERDNLPGFSILGERLKKYPYHPRTPSFKLVSSTAYGRVPTAYENTGFALKRSNTVTTNHVKITFSSTVSDEDIKRMREVDRRWL